MDVFKIGSKNDKNRSHDKTHQQGNLTRSNMLIRS